MEGRAHAAPIAISYKLRDLGVRRRGRVRDKFDRVGVHDGGKNGGSNEFASIDSANASQKYWNAEKHIGDSKRLYLESFVLCDVILAENADLTEEGREKDDEIC